jgi:hypothetical protein
MTRATAKLSMPALMMCWGARLMVAEICAVISLPFPGNSDLKSA